MWFSSKFESTHDDLHLEEGKSDLNDFLNFVKYVDFSFQGYGTIFIKQKSENMSVLHNGNHFFNVVFAGLHQDFLKEIGIVVQLVGQHEFRLEISPNAVILRTGRSQQYFFFKLVIERNCIFSILSQSVYFQVAGKITPVLVGKEEIFFLRVENVVIVC